VIASGRVAGSAEVCGRVGNKEDCGAKHEPPPPHDGFACAQTVADGEESPTLGVVVVLGRASVSDVANPH
jgi:hypothetical protein